jgi:uncharacterized membrane protein YfcA
LNLKASVPLAIASFVLSPFGAYFSTKADERIVGIIFTVSLFFAGIMTYVPKKKVSRIRAHISVPVSTGIGVLAGFLSGFLELGGGG